MIKTFLTTLIILTALATGAMAQTEELATYEWTAPTTGSPVSYYQVESSVDSGPFIYVATVDGDSLSYQQIEEVYKCYTVRVRGIDADSVPGPYSEASEVFCVNFGPPGAPGKPLRFN